MTGVRVVSIVVVSAHGRCRPQSAEQHHRYEQVIAVMAPRRVEVRVRVRYWSEAERLHAVRQTKRRSNR